MATARSYGPLGEGRPAVGVLGCSAAELSGHRQDGATTRAREALVLVATELTGLRRAAFAQERELPIGTAGGRARPARGRAVPGGLSVVHLSVFGLACCDISTGSAGVVKTRNVPVATPRATAGRRSRLLRRLPTTYPAQAKGCGGSAGPAPRVVKLPAPGARLPRSIQAARKHRVEEHLSRLRHVVESGPDEHVLACHRSVRCRPRGRRIG